MIASTLLCAALTVAPSVHAPAAPGLEVSWRAPESWVRGLPFEVTVVVSGAAGDVVPVELLSPHGFAVDGARLGAPAEATLELPAGTTLEVTLDLGPAIAAAGPRHDFQLTFPAGDAGGEPRPITAYEPAAKDVDFMQAPLGELDRYRVLMRTTAGEIGIRLWPDVAPNHVRNFLDLSHTGFYDGILFHRCIPGFVIQAGDPNTKDPNANERTFGSGNGPRKLDAEISAKKHTRGVLSMARLGDDMNSATSQFFICLTRVPGLDGKYTAFGLLTHGYDVVEDIVETPMAIDENPGERDPAGRPLREPTDRPATPQRIEDAFVVVPLGAKPE